MRRRASPRPSAGRRRGRRAAGRRAVRRHRARVGQKCVHVFGSRRQAGQVERHAAEERLLRGFAGRRQGFALETFEDEPIDAVPGPVAPLDGRRGQVSRRLERPVLTPPGPRVDPGLQQRDLGRGERAFRPRRRHHLRFIPADDPQEQLALGALPGHDDRVLRGEVRPRGYRAGGRPCGSWRPARGRGSSCRRGSAGCRG